MHQGATTNIWRKILRTIVYIFAFIGIIFTGVYIAMRLHLTDVTGSIDARNAYFNNVKKEFSKIKSASANNDKKDKDLTAVDECQILTITTQLPDNGHVILDTYISTRSVVVVEKMIRAVILVSESNTYLMDKINKCNVFADSSDNKIQTPSNQTIFDWILSPEWAALHDALIKDKDLILQASKDSGVPARMIISSVISEQFRFFTSNRESFKKFFEPLKILGNGTQFSYGVAGVKEETAQAIEGYLKDSSSQYYLGPSYEHVFDFKTDDPANERMQRLTDDKNHYYSYLYTGIFLRQIINQWQNAGYPINDRPEVLATLFNLGFNKSIPKPNPEVGGSTITINDRDYTFGGLAFQFYYSGELSDLFPLGVE